MSGSGISGLVIETEPTREPAGQPTGSCVPTASWASVHACKPLPADGLIVAPGGSVTATRLTCAVPSAAFDVDCGTRSPAVNAADEVKQPDLAKEAGELRGLNRGYGAVYYPWIRVRAPSVVKLPPNTITIAVPPSGHIAGIYARSDAQRGVHKAPANEVIQGALELTARLNDTEHGTLNAANVNVLRSFPNSPPMVWGARTLSQNPAYHYVGVERLLIYIEQSLQSGLRWAVFEPNDFSLWKKLERTVTEFLTRVWRSGALFGQSAEQAFFVKVDEELNPADSRALGMVIVEVGVAPVRPAEFVIIRLALREGGADE